MHKNKDKSHMEASSLAHFNSNPMIVDSTVQSRLCHKVVTVVVILCQQYLGRKEISPAMHSCAGLASKTLSTGGLRHTVRK